MSDKIAAKVKKTSARGEANSDAEFVLGTLALEVDELELDVLDVFEAELVLLALVVELPLLVADAVEDALVVMLPELEATDADEVETEADADEVDADAETDADEAEAELDADVVETAIDEVAVAPIKPKSGL